MSRCVKKHSFNVKKFMDVHWRLLHKRKSIATDEKELKTATQIGEKYAADFAVSEEELMADVDTLDRAQQKAVHVIDVGGGGGDFANAGNCS